MEKQLYGIVSRSGTFKGHHESKRAAESMAHNRNGSEPYDAPHTLVSFTIQWEPSKPSDPCPCKAAWCDSPKNGEVYDQGFVNETGQASGGRTPCPGWKPVNAKVKPWWTECVNCGVDLHHHSVEEQQRVKAPFAKQEADNAS